MTVSTEATCQAVLCRCIHSAVLRPQPNLGSPVPIQSHCPLSITAPMIEYMLVFRAGIFKPLWSPGIDAKASTPPAYVAWRAGTITLFLVGA